MTGSTLERGFAGAAGCDVGLCAAGEGAAASGPAVANGSAARFAETVRGLAAAAKGSAVAVGPKRSSPGSDASGSNPSMRGAAAGAGATLDLAIVLGEPAAAGFGLAGGLVGDFAAGFAAVEGISSSGIRPSMGDTIAAFGLA